MNATEQSYRELLSEYRKALSVWSEARAFYSPEAPEIVAAADHLEALEKEIVSFNQPEALAA